MYLCHYSFLLLLSIFPKRVTQKARLPVQGGPLARLPVQGGLVNHNFTKNTV